MRTLVLALGMTMGLGACSTATHTLVPDTPEGPASYVCYSSAVATPDEVLAVARRQCGRWGMDVTGLIGQTLSPGRCGLLTPMVAGYRCGPVFPGLGRY